jgi:aminoglycoside phosphotransferase (APT) family kinase protein
VAEQPVADRTAWAVDLADALAALHVPGPVDAPVNPVRGGPLAGRAEALEGRIADGHLDRVLDGAAAIGSGSGGAAPSPAEVRDRARRLLDASLAAPAWPGDPLWLHGDPHPANLLTRDGRLAALLDFGDMTTGDPATDLATAWLTFDATGRAAFRARTESRGDATGGPCSRTDPGLWSRAAGWALVMSSAMVTHGDDDPVIAAIGRHAVHALLG